jgi:phytoene/squalene synthetase
LQAHQAAWQAFDQQRRRFLAHLKVFSEFQDAIKAVTMRGESFNTATLRLLGHLPPAMQYILDQIPQRIGVLNEVIKGNEVFSNVGRVSAGSSLRRFLSAKDDGEAKELVWAVLTDDHDRMHITCAIFDPL